MSNVPLNPLRVFISASRYPTFVEAAQKLHVTPGAISRQVKVLEDYLGVELYTSGANKKELTAKGHSYAATLGPLLDEIDSQNARFISSNKGDSLRLACSNHFLRQWLLPHLGAFLDDHPTIEFSFDVLKPTMSADIRADVWIRYGSGGWTGYDSQLLMQPTLTPVCSPRYLAQHGRPGKPDDLKLHMLLQSEFRLGDWAAWCSAADIELSAETRWVTFAGTYLAYQAALMGSGIALGRSHMMEHDIASGNLIELFPQRVRVDSAFYLCTPKGGMAKPSVSAFSSWISAKIADQDAA